MRRVLIIGCGGAGKSTFGIHLAERTGLPLIHLDQAFWRPGWTVTPRIEWRGTVNRLVAAPAWILEGNYENSLDLRLPRADTVIWFDMPRHLCLRRVAKRMLTTYGRVRLDMAPGCPERLDLAFLTWIWNFNRTTRPKIQAMLDLHGSHLQPVIFRRDRDVRVFLRSALVNGPRS